MMQVQDQLGRQLQFSETPRRIVSCVPSITNYLADLKLDDEVVGITTFCLHPESWYRNKTRIGGTKTLHTDKIKDLNPELILMNKEENQEKHLRELEKFCPVYISNIKEIEQMYEMMYAVGKMCDRPEESRRHIAEIEAQRSRYQFGKNMEKSAAYLIWKNPWMLAGGDTFISTMLEEAGFRNAAGNKSRYPEITIEEIKALAPDFIFLSSEPFPFKEKHKREFLEQWKSLKTKQTNGPKKSLSQVIIVDGEMFSWYGSRIKTAYEYFDQLRSKLEL